MPATITEIKHNPNKPDQTFECSLVRHDGHRLVISYVSHRSYEICGVTAPAGTLTLAWYQEGLPYIVWKMIRPDDRLIGHYIHLCDEVRITPERVEYRDLILDVWFFPDGSYRLLDEDELDEAVAADRLDAATAGAARRTAAAVIDTFLSIRTSMESLLSRTV